jgi:DNA repair protein RadC
VSVLKKALDLNAAAVIFVHNHPGGTKRPGSDDILLTKKLCKASRALGIKPLDHLIITGDSYVSMKALKMMK